MKNEEKKPSVHSGHRQRMKSRFMGEGLANFADHEALELLLFYAIPQKDTNELAHNLITEFGSLDGVLDAPIDALTNVKGVGENSASLIKLVGEMYSKYLASKYNSEKTVLDNSDDAGEYFLPLLINQSKEVLMAAFLDSRNTVKNTVVISKGDLDSIDIDLKRIITTAVNCNSNKVIIAHNHPSGVAAPSANDIEAVRVMSVKLRSVSIHLCDSIIVAGTEYYSMTKHKKCKYYFE